MYNRLFAGARRRYSSNASQLKAGDEAIIKIEDMASSGYGFGKVMLDTPRTVFVPLTGSHFYNLNLTFKHRVTQWQLKLPTKAKCTTRASLPRS